MPTYEQTKHGYLNLWNAARTRPEWQKRAEAAAALIKTGRSHYDAIQRATGIPWQLIGVLHHMESGCDFSKHLHNGNSLARRTVDVPAGRPAAAPANGRSYGWAESAVDALVYKGLHRITDWCIERMLYQSEAYNGWGNYFKGVASAYVWSGTTLYTKGKYVKDHVFDANHVSKQIGVAAILRLLYKPEKDMNAELKTLLGQFAHIAPVLVSVVAGPGAGLAVRVIAEAVTDDKIEATAEAVVAKLGASTFLTTLDIIKRAETIISSLVPTPVAPIEVHETPVLSVDPPAAIQPSPMDLMLGDKLTGMKTYLAIAAAVVVNVAATLHMAPTLLTPENLMAINVFLSGLGGAALISKIERYAKYAAVLRR